jgi:endonuclease YncB( thermonuclease family)
MLTEEKQFESHDIHTSFFSLNGVNTYARLVDVYDGDTITCVIPLFNNYYKFHVRLNDLDTCEMKSKNEELKERAFLARKKVLDTICKDNTLQLHCCKKDIQNYFLENNTVIWLECLTFDKYGRLLANVYEKDDKTNSLSSILINCHLGYPYAGGTKLNEDEQYENM